MGKQTGLNWLYEELPDLIEKGVLTSDAADRLKVHYGPVDNQPTHNLAFIIIGILGAVLIGGGIILIFAYNWEDLSRTWRTIFSFLPLVMAQIIYAYTFFKKQDSTAWVEGSSAFLMLMLAACIALISQTYNIGGSMESFLFTWMLLSIPLMYLMNASLPTVFYLIGIASWASHIRGSESVMYWAFLFAVLPHLYFNIKSKASSNRVNILCWAILLTLVGAYFFVVENNLIPLNLFGAASLLSLFYFIGKYIYRKGVQFIQAPFQTFVVILIFILSMILTFTYPEGFSERNWEWVKNYDNWAATINLVVIIGSFLTMLFLVGKSWNKDRKINWFVVGFPLLILMCNFLVQMKWTGIIEILLNVYLFVFGLYYIKEGIEWKRMGLVNLGMFFVSAIITARFFDADISLIVKGIVFVVLGVGFLRINYVLSKRFRNRLIE